MSEVDLGRLLASQLLKRANGESISIEDKQILIDQVVNQRKSELGDLLSGKTSYDIITGFALLAMAVQVLTDLNAANSKDEMKKVVGETAGSVYDSTIVNIEIQKTVRALEGQGREH